LLHQSKTGETRFLNTGITAFITHTFLPLSAAFYKYDDV
jgi:hypothetical protein